MTDDLKEMGCTCHSHPPCPFCMDLTEEEADIFSNEGMSALRTFWREEELEKD